MPAAVLVLCGLGASGLYSGEGRGDVQQNVQHFPYEIRKDVHLDVSRIVGLSRLYKDAVRVPETPPVPTANDGRPLAEAVADRRAAQGAIQDYAAAVATEPELSEGLTDAEAIICGIFPDCAKALRVARCESGPDYYAGYGVHVGTWQVNLGLHAWRFYEHGYDPYTQADDIHANTLVAWDIYLERGWAAWPWCGYQ